MKEFVKIGTWKARRGAIAAVNIGPRDGAVTIEGSGFKTISVLPEYPEYAAARALYHEIEADEPGAVEPGDAAGTADEAEAADTYELRLAPAACYCLRCRMLSKKGVPVFINEHAEDIVCPACRLAETKPTDEIDAVKARLGKMGTLRTEHATHVWFAWIKERSGLGEGSSERDALLDLEAKLMPAVAKPTPAVDEIDAVRAQIEALGLGRAVAMQSVADASCVAWIYGLPSSPIGRGPTEAKALRDLGAKLGPAKVAGSRNGVFA